MDEILRAPQEEFPPIRSAKAAPRLLRAEREG